MPLIDDLLTAINAYPYHADNVEIDIVNFSGGGGQINAGEIWNFQVRVVNNGKLDMKNLDLRIYGSEWATVSKSSFPILFRSLLSTEKKDLDAHSTVTFGSFYMRAVQATGSGSPNDEHLVSVHIGSYDAGLQSTYLL
jgi:hypothetical protein